MSKIALFGGSFDPIHKGHIEIAKIARYKMELDKVIFIPSGESPHKGELITSKEDRLLMTKKAIEGEDDFFLSDYEIKKEGKSYTYETVKEFKKLYPEDEIYFIIGDDQYKVFSSWYRYDELLDMCKIIVFTREGAKIEPPFMKVEIRPIDISSHSIREKIEKGEDFKYLVPDGVYEYILEKKLYGI